MWGAHGLTPFSKHHKPRTQSKKDQTRRGRLRNNAWAPRGRGECEVIQSESKSAARARNHERLNVGSAALKSEKSRSSDRGIQCGGAGGEVELDAEGGSHQSICVKPNRPNRPRERYAQWRRRATQQQAVQKAARETPAGIDIECIPRNDRRRVGDSRQDRRKTASRAGTAQGTRQRKARSRTECLDAVAPNSGIKRRAAAESGESAGISNRGYGDRQADRCVRMFQVVSSNSWLLRQDFQLASRTGVYHGRQSFFFPLRPV